VEFANADSLLFIPVNKMITHKRNSGMPIPSRVYKNGCKLILDNGLVKADEIIPAYQQNYSISLHDRNNPFTITTDSVLAIYDEGIVHLTCQLAVDANYQPSVIDSEYYCINDPITTIDPNYIRSTYTLLDLYVNKQGRVYAVVVENHPEYNPEKEITSEPFEYFIRVN
jgi:hypothetical protein